MDVFSSRAVWVLCKQVSQSRMPASSPEGGWSVTRHSLFVAHHTQSTKQTHQRPNQHDRLSTHQQDKLLSWTKSLNFPSNPVTYNYNMSKTTRKTQNLDGSSCVKCCVYIYTPFIKQMVCLRKSHLKWVTVSLQPITFPTWMQNKHQASIPSIVNRLSRVGSQGQKLQQRAPDSPGATRPKKRYNPSTWSWIYP